MRALFWLTLVFGVPLAMLVGHHVGDAFVRGLAR